MAYTIMPSRTFFRSSDFYFYITIDLPEERTGEVKFGESQKQIKQSFWDEINTPDVLKLKEESNTLWEDYRIVDKKLLRKILADLNLCVQSFLY